MLRWFSWLYDVKKKDEEKRIEVEHEKFNGIERKSADSEGGRRCQAVDTEQPRSQAFGRFDCITSVQKQTPGYGDALLRSVGTCWKMLRPMLLRASIFMGLTQIIASLTRERITEKRSRNT